MKSKLLLGLFCAALVIGSAVVAQAPSVHGVGLTWTPSTTAGVNYNIFRCSGTCSSIFPSGFTLLTSTPVPCNANSAGLCQYEDPASDLTISTPYTYAVTAVDSSGDQSGPSNMALVTTPATFPSNPAAPSGCNAKNN